MKAKVKLFVEGVILLLVRKVLPSFVDLLLYNWALKGIDKGFIEIEIAITNKN